MISTTATRRTASIFRQAATALALIATTVQTIPAAAQAPTNADLVATIESVVRTDSQAWWLNSYDRGSIHAPRVTWTSPDGRGYVIRASYTYNGGARGYVDLPVRDGRIACLQYWDSSACTPMRTKPAPWAEVVLVGVGLMVLGAATNGSSSSRSGTSSGNASTSGSQRYEYYEQRRYETPAPAPREDTSVGCSWGDRSTGTCH